MTVTTPSSPLNVSAMYQQSEVRMLRRLFGQAPQKRTQAQGEFRSIFAGASLQLQQYSLAQYLFVAVTILGVRTLANIYLQAFLANMNENAGITDFSISNVTIQPYNQAATMYQLLPIFMAMICLYAAQLSHKKHVLYGAAIALVGAPAVFYFDLAEHKALHYMALAVLLKGMWQWKPEFSMPWQHLLTTVAFVTATPAYIIRETMWDTAVLGVWVGIGELMFLVAWASTMFNQ